MLNKFSFNRWDKKDFVFKGKIENDKINITEKLTFSDGWKGTIKYSGEFINDKKQLNGALRGNAKEDFFRSPELYSFKILSEATEEIIKFYNPGIPLQFILRKFSC